MIANRHFHMHQVLTDTSQVNLDWRKNIPALVVTYLFKGKTALEDTWKMVLKASKKKNRQNALDVVKSTKQIGIFQKWKVCKKKVVYLEQHQCEVIMAKISVEDDSNEEVLEYEYEFWNLVDLAMILNTDWGKTKMTNV